MSAGRAAWLATPTQQAAGYCASVPPLCACREEVGGGVAEGTGQWGALAVQCGGGAG